MATYRGEGQTAQLFIWLRLHGANPDEVLRDADMTISTDDNGVRWLHWSQFALINGGRYMNPWGTGAAIEKHATRLVAPPPDWWEPQIQPTRERLLEAIAAVHALHVRNPNCGDCEHCSERDYPDYAVSWPCPTMQALGDLQSEETP